MIVQKATSSVNPGGGTSASVALGSAVTAGNLIAVVASFASSATPGISSFTDTQGRTYTIDVGSKLQGGPTTNYGQLGVAVGYVANIAGSAAPTVTVNFNAGVSARICISVYEMAAAAFDQAVSATGSSATPSAGSITTPVNGCAGVAVMVIDDGGGFGNSITAGAGWTLDGQGGGGSSDAGAESREIATAGAVTGNFGNSGHSGTWYALAATFKPAAPTYNITGQDAVTQVCANGFDDGIVVSFIAGPSSTPPLRTLIGVGV